MRSRLVPLLGIVGCAATSPVKAAPPVETPPVATVETSTVEAPAAAPPSSTQSTAPASEVREVRVRATVTEPPHAPGAADVGRDAWAVGPDPRFLVELDIAASSADLEPLSPGRQLFFIHSPSRTFGQRVRTGQSFEVSLQLRSDPPAVVSLSR